MREARKGHAVVGLGLRGGLAGSGGRSSVVGVVSVVVLLLGIWLLTGKIAVRWGNGVGGGR